MQWMLISLTGAFSCSGAFASLSPMLKAGLDVHTRSSLLGSEDVGSSTVHLAEKRNVTTPNFYSRSLSYLFPRQAVGRCGADFSNQRCGGNQCCSSYGYCGTEFEVRGNLRPHRVFQRPLTKFQHCGLIVGCQPDFGRCGDAVPEPTPTPTPSPSPTPLPPTSSSVIPPLPTGTLIPSTNGQCGNVTTCAGSTFGSCCSEYYYCGNSLDFCGSGCRPGFGTCGGVAPPPGSSSLPIPPSSSSTRPPPTSTATPSPTSSAAPVPTNVSTNGRCGPDGNGQTCTRSSFGRCCSSYGWCGNGQDDYCRLSWGCQPQFGTCG